jgi:hypothetical protein
MSKKVDKYIAQNKLDSKVRERLMESNDDVVSRVIEKEITSRVRNPNGWVVRVLQGTTKELEAEWAEQAEQAGEEAVGYWQDEAEQAEQAGEEAVGYWQDDHWYEGQEESEGVENWHEDGWGQDGDFASSSQEPWKEVQEYFQG